MYLSGVGCALPTEQIFNDEIVELVAYYSRAIYTGELDTLLARINAKLRRLGIASRYWRSSKESPIGLLQQACEIALKQSNIDRHAVNFVIYVGVDRGFAEPANACFIAKELGMNRARTFDVADACLGWSTATEIAQALFASAPGAAALIVSAEFPMRLGGAVMRECFRISSDLELEWKFPALTLGEAATASILLGGGPSWRYVQETHNEFADLCTVGLGASFEYAGQSSRLSPSAECEFRAYGRELTKQTVRPAVRVLRELLSRIEMPRIIFPHSVMGPYVVELAERASPGLALFSTFAEQGNIATSSLPSCISQARQNGVFGANDTAVGWVAASGIKVSAFEIVQRV
jgi:acyl-CoA:acyl-CoA alkyltransferase